MVCQLGEAKVERHESSRAAKKQELIENLKRLFPGVVSAHFLHRYIRMERRLVCRLCHATVISPNTLSCMHSL